MSINRRLGVPMANGNEQDALSPRSKKLFRWRAGVRKALKTAFNRRVRRQSADIDNVGSGNGAAKGREP